ncbi:MAG: acylphosphatase [Promethearchaeota archaeon]|jgi:acylphosphatase
MKEKRIIIKVFGLVQGVFFRYSTRKFARNLGLTGYVKNMPDGSVYIEAEGPEKKLKKLLEYSRKGPKNARVDQLDYEYKIPEFKYKGFDYMF